MSAASWAVYSKEGFPRCRLPVEDPQVLVTCCSCCCNIEGMTPRKSAMHAPIYAGLSYSALRKVWRRGFGNSVLKSTFPAATWITYS